MKQGKGTALHEREVLNQRIFALEEQKRELESKCGLLSRENGELKGKNREFDEKIRKLEEELGRGRKAGEEALRLREEVQRLRISWREEVSGKNEEIRQIRQKKENVEGRLELSLTEKQRLEHEKGDLERGLQLQKAEMIKFSKQSKEQLEEMQRNLERQQMEGMRLKQKEFDLKLENFKREYDGQTRILKSKVIEFEKQGVFFKKEKEYLDQKNQELRGELEKTKFQSTTLQEDYEQEIHELEEKVRTFKASYVNPRDYEIKFRAEKSKLETDLMQERAKVRELNMGIQNLQSENRRLGQLTSRRLREMEEFKRKLGEHGSLENIENLKAKLKMSEREVDDLQEKIMKVKGEKNAMLSNISHLKSEVENLRSDNYDLDEMIKRKKAQLKGVEGELTKYKKSYSQMYSERHKSEGDRMVGQEKLTALRLNLER